MHSGISTTMFKRHFIIIFLAGFALCTMPIQAQVSEADNNQQQTEVQEAPSEDTPPIIRVEIIGDESEVKSRHSLEERSEVRELEALAVQQGMSEASQKIASYTFHQTLLSFFQTFLIAVGTAALIYTLYLTRQANEAALRGAEAAETAVSNTQQIGEAQVRAYVSWNGAIVSTVFTENSIFAGYSITPQVLNTGKSPAILSHLYSSSIVVSGEEEPAVSFDLASAECDINLGAGNPIGLADQFLTVEDARRVRDGSAIAYLLGWVAYRHIFMNNSDADKILKFCFRIDIHTDPSNIMPGPSTGQRLVNFMSVINYQISPEQNA